MTNAARARARDDQVAALLRDRGPSTTRELWAVTGYDRLRPPPFSYTDLYSSLRRLEGADLVTAFRAVRQHGVLWAPLGGEDHRCQLSNCH